MARDLEEASLMFLKSCFDYNPTGRPKSRFVDKSFFRFDGGGNKQKTTYVKAGLPVVITRSTHLCTLKFNSGSVSAPPTHA